MLIRREMIAAAIHATDSDPLHHGPRYDLGAVNVEPSGRVSATNGHVAITVTQSEPYPDADFPIVPGAPFHGSPVNAVRIPAYVAKRLIAATPKKSTIPVLSCLQVSKNGSDLTSTVAATDLETPMVTTITVDEKSFPDIDRVLASAKGDTVTLPIAVDVLEAMIAAAKAVAGTGKGAKTPIIVLEVPRDNDPEQGQIIGAVRFRATGIDGMAVDGVAMPIRIPGRVVS